MAILEKHILFKRVTGKIGDVVIRRVKGKIIISAAPVFTKPKTAKQLEQCQRFKEAMQYAKEKLTDPKMKLIYEKRAEKWGYPNAYNAVVKEYLSQTKVTDMK
jgi:hypothetical protein